MDVASVWVRLEVGAAWSRLRLCSVSLWLDVASVGVGLEVAASVGGHDDGVWVLLVTMVGKNGWFGEVLLGVLGWLDSVRGVSYVLCWYVLRVGEWTRLYMPERKVKC